MNGARLSLEPPAILVAGMLGFIGWTLYAGPDLNWDLLHYHLYVGLHASGDALATDYFPAGSTSYLAPYAYWPLASMVAAKWPAMLVGSVMAAMHSLAVLATWYLAKQLFPGASREVVLLRLAATCVAVICALVLTEVGTSFADITAAIPLVLGVALWLKALAASRYRARAFVLAGLCFGLAIALKLTSVPFAVAAYASLALLWCVRQDVRWRDLVIFGGAMAAGFAAGYGYWGFQLWREFGNPFFPLFHAFFQPPEVLAAAPGVAVGVTAPRTSLLGAVSDILFSSTNRHQRFLPRDIWDWLLRPLYMVDPVANVYTEVRAPDARFLALFLLAPFALWKLRQQFRNSSLAALLLLFLTGWTLWMATSGNGRYLMPWALVVGPALAGCARTCWPQLKLPALTAIAVFIFAQSALLWEGAQLRWAGSAWEEEYVSTVLPREVTERPMTFVAMDGQSASWLSAFVHPGSRFASPGSLSLRSAPGKSSDRFGGILERSSEIVAVIRFNYVEAETGKPFPPTPGNQEIARTLMGLQVDASSCVTGTLVEEQPQRTAEFASGGLKVQLTAVQGFFFCSANYVPGVGRVVPRDPLREAALDRIERMCPRQYPPGSSQTLCANNMCKRVYSATDTELAVTAAGVVTARHYGAMQEPFLGTVVELSRDGSNVRCHEELGRYAPWSPGANLLAPAPLEPDQAPAGSSR